MGFDNRQYTCHSGKMHAVKYTGSDCSGSIEKDWTVSLGTCTHWNDEAYAMIQCRADLGNSMPNSTSDTETTTDATFELMMESSCPDLTGTWRSSNTARVYTFHKSSDPGCKYLKTSPDDVAQREVTVPPPGSVWTVTSPTGDSAQVSSNLSQMIWKSGTTYFKFGLQSLMVCP